MDIVDACIDGTLDRITLEWKPGASCAVVMASGGYPDSYETGFEITGIKDAGEIVFEAGTKLQDGITKTSGGRVLAVYADADTLDEAIDKAYAGVSKIRFRNMHYRKDIGRTLSGGKN